MRVHHFFEYWARQAPHRLLVTDGARTATYGSASGEVDRVAGTLLAWGCRPGDRVAMLARNRVEYVLLYLAASKLGLAIVPLNQRLVAADWGRILRHARPTVLLCDGEHRGAVDGLRTELAGVARFASFDGPERPGWEHFGGRVARQPARAAEGGVSDDRDFLVIYTSGTTGTPAGVRLTHRAVMANVVQLRIALPFGPGDRSLAVVPMFHAGIVPSVLTPIVAGGSLHVMPRFDAADVLRALGEEAIALATLVPSMIAACLAEPGLGRRSYDRLGCVYYGASSIDERTLRAAAGAFGCDLVQSYGLTEATQALTLLTPADHRLALSARPGLLASAGRPVAGTELRVVDASGAPVEAGVPGEILARGPQLMSGYLDDPERTEAILAGGWLRTGDVGVLDGAGYLRVVDRLKDVIVSGGENVYPQKVERVLRDHPAVADVAVVGAPDERWGEAVKAVVVPRRSEAVTAEDLIEFCRPRLGGFERPRQVEFRESLPRTGSGKVLKRALRAMEETP